MSLGRRLLIVFPAIFLLSAVRELAMRPGPMNDDTFGLIMVVGIFVAAGMFIAALAFGKRFLHRRRFIDAKLDSLLGGLRFYRAYSKILPRFRYVDLFRAASTLTSESPGWIELETAHHEPLALIFNRRIGYRRINQAERSICKIGPAAEQFFPEDKFWVLPKAAAKARKTSPCVIRIRRGPQAHQTTVEVAAKSVAESTDLIERLVQRSAENSIYRNHLLDLEFAGEIRDDEGNVEQHENFDLVFKPSPAVGPDDIVLDEEVARALDRNVLDFHRRRDVLRKLGLPSRRGVLLYGPPGTGKTYTCKYLASQLAGTITTLVASGESLLRVRTLCNLARLFQPALVVLEDVDLVYATRESGAGHNASLGKLMDELDGFGRDDRIIFVLTTNAIDRVERAVSDRPGRISQCIFLGPPSDPLRRRYLRRLLTPYDARNVNLDVLTRETDGTTQAFLKELIFRAVQIASLPPTAAPAPGNLLLRDEDFTAAMTEMRAAGGRAGETIIGFRTVGF